MANPLHRPSLAFFLVQLALLVNMATAQDEPQNLPVTQLRAGIHSIRAQVAETPLQHMVGLMHRRSMASNEGMLFIFPESSKQCFWMKNTLLPLSAAFVMNDGTLVNIEDMQPHSLESHCSTKPVRFVLEMNQGWFAKRGLKPGDRLRGAPFESR